MNVLQIGSDRSKRGLHMQGSSAYLRQKKYAEKFGRLDIIGYTLKSDGFEEIHDGPLHVYPTNSLTKLSYRSDAKKIAQRLPRPEVVSAQDPHDSGLTALHIARHLGVPLHIQMHSDIFSTVFAEHSVMNFIRRLVASYVLRRASGIRVVSERIKMSIGARITPKRLTVLPIYVDIEKFKNAQKDTVLAEKFSRFQTKLLFVGRLESEKNPRLALLSFAAVAPESACLIIVGEGSERAIMEKTVRALHLDGRVFFEGERDSVPYYRIADLLLVTSRYEGYGLVIVEALASGLPVLSTDVGVAREAGAIVADAYPKALQTWFEHGPHTASLSSYPYRTFDEYATKYCDDIMALV